MRQYAGTIVLKFHITNKNSTDSASRGPSAIAELLVQNICWSDIRTTGVISGERGARTATFWSGGGGSGTSE